MSVADRRRRRLFVGILASVALLSSSFAFVQLRADEAWRQMVVRGAELRAQWQATWADAGREPLWGDATAGRAFEHYERAAAAVKPLQEQGQELAKLMLLSDDELAEALATHGAALRETWREGLDDLRRGAHAADVRPPGDGFAEIQTANLLTYRALCNGAMLEARHHRHLGEHRAAVHLTLDAATLGADLLRTGLLIDQMIGCVLVAIVTEAWPDGALRALPAPERDLLDRGLARLDDQLPLRLDMTRELLFFAEAMQRVPDQTDWCGGGSWNYGFSQRWMLADAFRLSADGYARLAAHDDDWRARRAAFHEFVAEVLASGNRACAAMVPNIASAEYTLREVVARVRLLRAAIALHRGDADVALRDPFGTAALTVRAQDDGGFVLESHGDEDRRRLERIVRP